MADYKIDYKLTAPQTYDDGRKLPRDTTRGTVTVSAPTFDDAKKKALPMIRDSQKYKQFSDRQSFNAPRKPRIKVLKPLKPKGAGGTTKSGDVIEIQEKFLVNPRDITKKFKGGLIRKPKLAVKGY